MRERGSFGNHGAARRRRRAVELSAARISPQRIYELLSTRFDDGNWWHASSRFEVVVGALLTQHTSWKNVEVAILGLKREGLMRSSAMSAAPLSTLYRLIRGTGFYRQKASRLKRICERICAEYGTLDRLFALNTRALRKALLSFEGIGNETADSIMLYAANRPVFVIDAYTRRMLGRLNGTQLQHADYDALRGYFESGMRRSAELYRNCHAKIVELGKSNCKAKPVCVGCPLNGICAYAHSHG